MCTLPKVRLASVGLVWLSKLSLVSQHWSEVFHAHEGGGVGWEVNGVANPNTIILNAFTAWMKFGELMTKYLLRSFTSLKILQRRQFLNLCSYILLNAFKILYLILLTIVSNACKLMCTIPAIVNCINVDITSFHIALLYNIQGVPKKPARIEFV